MSKLQESVLPALLTAVFIAIGLACPAAVHADPPFSKVVVFGDSLSDTGNAHLITRGWAASEPYFDGRFSNGPVWVEHLAVQLGLPAPAPFLLGGTNYAWGSAQTGGGFAPTGVPNVGTQIDIFLAVDGPPTGDELIVVLAGGNDALWLSKSPWAAARNMSNHVATLAASGGKVFLVPTLFAPGQTPLVRGTEAEFISGLWALLYNDALDRHLRWLEWRLGIEVLRFDAAGLTDAIVDDPILFGFTNVTEPACPECGFGVPLPGAGETIVPFPDEYLWWDFIHPTRALHELLGEFAAAQVEEATRPAPTG